MLKEDIIKEIQRLRDMNLSYQKIADSLNERKISTISGRSKWNKGSVSRMLVIRIDATKNNQAKSNMPNKLNRVKQDSGDELSKVKHQKEELAKELKQVKQTNSDLQNKLNRVKQDSGDELSKVKHQKEELAKELKQVKQTNSDLQNKLNRVKQDTDELSKVKHQREELAKENSENNFPILLLELMKTIIPFYFIHNKYMK